MNIFPPDIDSGSSKSYIPGSSKSISLDFSLSGSSNSVTHDMLPPKRKNVMKVKNIPSVEKYVPVPKPSSVSGK